MKYSKEKAFDYENGFMLTSEIYRMGNMLAHYELYKKILNLPGAVVELGVFKGNSLIQFATFRELLENERSRKIIGFDMFGKFPNTPRGGGGTSSDLKFIENWNNQFSDEFISKTDIEKFISDKGIGNVKLVEGNILETLDSYIKENPQLRIALLHVDTDVYEPSKYGLEKLFNRVVRGGIVAFDDYGTVEGESVAVDEFLNEHSEYELRKFTLSHEKPSFFVKR